MDEAVNGSFAMDALPQSLSDHPGVSGRVGSIHTTLGTRCNLHSVVQDVVPNLAFGAPSTFLP